MRLGCLIPASLCLLIYGVGVGARGAERASVSEDERSLQAAGLATDGPALLEFLRQRARATAARDQVQALIRQLGAGTPESRKRALGELVSLGAPAVPFLRQALKDPDEREVLDRARSCLEAIDNAALPAAVARLVAERKPDGAAQALLSYLPFADDEDVVEEVQAALRAVSFRGEEPDAALPAALVDTVAIRRASAAVALCQGSGIKETPRVRSLLRDPKPTVRLRVALALGALHDQQAIPVLIDLLGQLPQSQGKQAEEFLVRLAGPHAPAVSLGSDEPARQKCHSAWTAWWNGVEPAALLDCLRKRTLPDGDRDKILALIKQLGDDTFEVRVKASAELERWGPAAVLLLQQALSSADVEVRSRVEDCLKVLQTNKEAVSPASAARLLALRKPRGAAEVLLGYLPFADEDAVAEAVQDALQALAFHDGEVDPVLLRALSDESALKRAVAAEALCRARAGQQRAVRRLLQDPEPAVRLRASLALAALKDREAVPVLIALLADLGPEQIWQVEEVLYRLAGESAPSAQAGSDETSRRKYRDAWAEWWRAHGSAVDLARLDGPQQTLGYTLIMQMDQICEVGPDRKVRWRILGLTQPLDAQLLPGNRVLICETNAGRITERDLKGNILWQQQPVRTPIGCQRLPNGNTFIATCAEMFEVDRDHKEVFRYNRPADDLTSATKLPNGQFLCLTATGQCLRLDSKGRELKNFYAGTGTYGGMTVLPDGGVLVAQCNNNRVVEYDADGKARWEASIAVPVSAVRLANGHTLVACHKSQRVVELERTGKVVWELKIDGFPWRARRR